MKTRNLCIALVLAGFAFAADAAGKAPLAQCVDLGANQEVARSKGGQSLVLRDGDSHYLVTLRGTCGALAITPTLTVLAEGTENRICPEGTLVRTRRGECRVQKVETIDAGEFAARKRRYAH